MRLVKLSLAASILVASGIAAAAVEMVRPFEALEQSRRAMIEVDKRQKREQAEQRKREKEQEAKRKHEEGEQRKRERVEKAQAEAQRKRDAAAAKAAQGARSPSTSLPPQPSAAPALAHESSAQAATASPQAQDAERQPLVQNAPPARPQVGGPSPTAPPPAPPATGRVNQGQDKPEGRVRSAGPSAAGASGTPHNTAAITPAARSHTIAVSRLKRMNLYNERGDKLGDVEQVVQSPDGNFHIVFGAGGFLGFREHHVRIPLERVTIRGNRLVIPGLTDDQVRIMPVFDRSDRTYRDLTRNATVPIVREQSEN